MAFQGFGRRSRNNIMNWMFGQTPATAPTAWYISAHTGDPLDDASAAAATECTGGGYARAQVLAANWTALTNTPPPPAADANSITSNNATVLFPISSGAWSAGANITYYAMWTSSSLQTEAAFIGRWPATGTIQAVTGINQQLQFPLNAFAPFARPVP